MRYDVHDTFRYAAILQNIVPLIVRVVVEAIVMSTLIGYYVFKDFHKTCSEGVRS